MTRSLKAGLTALILLCWASATVAQERPRIIAVNYALKYLAEQLVGDAAEVIYPVPEDVDPSFWRPSIADISAIQSADLILLNGAGFATWIDRVSLPRSRLVNTSAAIKDQYIVTKSITHSHGDGGEHSHEGLASYVWLDPTLAAAQAEAVANAISRRNLAPDSDVEARLASLLAELEALDAQAASDLAAATDVQMIATHPRYQYFAARYGLSVSSLEWEAGDMPSPEQLSDLEALIGQTGARVLLWEAEPPAAALDAAAELGLANVIFEPLARMPDNPAMTEVFAQAVREISQAASENR